MYYEEQIINGILMYRGDPNGEWRQVKAEELCKRITALEERVAQYKQAVDFMIENGGFYPEAYDHVEKLLTTKGSE